LFVEKKRKKGQGGGGGGGGGGSGGRVQGATKRVLKKTYFLHSGNFMLLR